MLAAAAPRLTEDEALRELQQHLGCNGSSESRKAARGSLPVLRTGDGLLAGLLAELPLRSSRGSSPSRGGPFSSRGVDASQEQRGPRKTSNGVLGAIADRDQAGVRACGEIPSRLSRVDRVDDAPKVCVASTHVKRGQVVAVARPVAAVQTSDTLPWVVACAACLKHVGDLESQLAIASGLITRAQAFATEQGLAASPRSGAARERLESEETRLGNGHEAATGHKFPPLPGLTERFIEKPVLCPEGCGTVFCGEECRSRYWEAGHASLCLGLANDESHPLVRHKVHAISHPELEGPLLIASQLLVQALRKTTPRRQRMTTPPSSAGAPFNRVDENADASGMRACSPVVDGADARRGTEPATSASIVPGRSPSKTPPPSKRSTSHQGTHIDMSQRPKVALNSAGRPLSPDVVSGDDGAENEEYDSEDSTVGQILQDLFPRGRFSEGSDRAPDAATVHESWTLLKEVLRSEAGSDGVHAGDAEESEAIPSERVFSNLVKGLATNLTDIEVLSPLVEYCGALVTSDPVVQAGALRVLEPALSAMEADSEGEDNEAGNTCADLNDLVHEADAALRDKGNTGGSAAARNGSDGRAHLPNRVAARLAWRCLEASRIAARVVPPLRVKVLLPATALRWPHSCAPSVKMPAGDPREYRSTSGRATGHDGDGFPTAGAPGWPLTAATVALRDIPRGAPLSCSWIDESQRIGGRTAALSDYVDDAAGWMLARSETCSGCSSERPEWQGGAESSIAATLGQDESDRSQAAPRVRRCACSRCRVERRGGERNQASDGSPRFERAEVDELLGAARFATDEDRFDDASYALRCAANLAPEDGDVLYRAGVCAINQGRWSRALRLWREGLALSPDHRELEMEADKYHAYAFWNTAASMGCDSAADAATGTASAPFSTPPLSHPATPARADLSARNARETLAENLSVTFMGGGEWVCETIVPPLSATECAAVIEEAEETAAAAAAAARLESTNGSGVGGGNGWGTARHYAVPTTDIAVRNLPRTLAWFNDAMRERIAPLVASAATLGAGHLLGGKSESRRGCTARSPSGLSQSSREHGAVSGAEASGQDSDEDSYASDGNSTARDEMALDRRLRVHDAFVVRYDAAAQRSLPLHTDQGELSLTISLNSTAEYAGGGTWFEDLGRAVRPDEPGHVVVFPGGDVMHGGREITDGVRYILAVFLYEHWEEEEEEEDEEAGDDAYVEDDEEADDEEVDSDEVDHDEDMYNEEVEDED